MAGKLKKGSLVKVIAEKLVNSLEAKASDTRFPSYLFESKGEILDMEGDYALVQFYVATPNIWLKIDSLEAAT
ncbi:NAD(P)H-quinone oxidoreductase subunit O [Hyella patelloides LEGE 07179]|uniref:NAD(P)H-quinone oxidoreductase subunit O n=1 Tax=Hyella patelloides LEGE 07179 TaxID=945734 RepID=A0A563VRZ2_9CYAN|nr:NAD(P)H-quinone oxidoreductase subunit O [Hyella patelloides]VEP14224.1 NAD(P)H-quinone oxidoreductase subunit O [Hyella patelloides LEGE 07179]